MPPFLTIQVMVGAALLTVAVVHATVGARSRTPWRHRLFAVAALLAAAESFCAPWRYLATTGDRFVLAVKFSSTFWLLFVLALVWFVALHFNSPSYRWPVLLSLWTGAVVALNLSLKFTLLYRDVPKITTRVLPWGERISVPVAEPNRLLLLANLCVLTMVIYVFTMSLRLRSQAGDLNVARRLVAGLIPLLFLAYPHGVLVNWGILPPPHFYSFAIFGLVLVMSGALLGEAVQTAQLTKQVEADQRRWTSVLENVNLLVAGCDTEGRFNYLNPYCLKTSGYTADQLIGKTFCAIAARSDLARTQSWLKGLLAGTQVTNEIEAQMVTKTGEVRTIEWSSVLLFDSARNPAGTVSIGIDVTEARAALVSRDEALRELERLKARIEAENIYLKEEVQQTLGSSQIIGQSGAIQYVLQKIQQVAQTDATVLIEGETGAGKELVARALHEASGRARGPFIRVNCAALPPTLIESELFGHEKGSFTGADRLRKGRFELAEGGTLFLDEVAELPLDMQVKLLRVLQEGEYERVGDSRTRLANVRIISATNRDLLEQIRSGRFREDLFYRLQVYPISVPPLRERREDIPILATEFVRRLSVKHGRHIEQIPGYVLEELKEREWPGNVRELLNVIERAVITSNGAALALAKDSGVAEHRESKSENAAQLLSMANAERAHILKVLEHAHGKIAGFGGAAEILEMHPNTLRARMDKLGILKSAERRAAASSGDESQRESSQSPFV